MPDEIMFLAQGIEAAIAEMDATGIDASSAASGFHEHNLLDRKQGTLWKAGGTGNGWIKWDMGENYTASAIGIINGNPFTGGNASNKWRLQVDTSADWAFGTPVNRLAAQTPVAGDEPFWYEEFSECTARYWRVYLPDILINISKFGYPLLGTPWKTDLPYNRPRPMRSSYGIDVRETPFGHRHSNLRFEDRKIWRRADFDVLTEEDWDDLFQYLWQASKGGHYPCLFRDVDDSLNWIRINGGRGHLDYQESLNHFFQAPFVFEQEF